MNVQPDRELPTPAENRKHILRPHAEATRMLAGAEASPEKVGLKQAKEYVKQVEKLMRDYGIKPDA